MFDWVLSTPLFTATFTYRERSEYRKINRTQKMFRQQKVQLRWMTTASQIDPFL